MAASAIFKEAQADANARYAYYKALSEMDPKMLLGELTVAPSAAPAQV